MKENEKDLTKELDLESLDSVSGGNNVVDILRRDEMRSGARSMSAGADGLDPAGPQTGGAAIPALQGMGSTSVLLKCPVCKRETPHMVFSGSRAKCVVCGDFLEKV